MTNLLDMMKKKNITVIEIAKKLDVATSQIYYWNKHGISVNNKHFHKLKEILPDILPKEATLKLNGEEDERFKAGRKKNKLMLKETTIPEYKEKDFESSLFPKIYIYKKTT